MPDRNRTFLALSSAGLIVLVSASLGLLFDWRAPGLTRYANDWLTRERGPLPVPQDIAIVAIDEKSIGAFGRFPWPRTVLAKTIEAISADQPKVIAVDVLFTDPTIREDDEALAQSIERAGNVVVAAQLIDAPAHGGPAAWLMPLPEIAAAAAGMGHVNVQVEMDDVARRIDLQASDDAGKTMRALPVEAVRVGDKTLEQSVLFTGRSLVLGNRSIPAVAEDDQLLGELSGSRPPVRLQTGRMSIDYIGPAGSFDTVTYSVADVVRGAVPSGSFRGKYVWIGATAASESDRVASPFVHSTDSHADEHGILMPGVEVLANTLNTILRQRFYSDSSAWAAFLWAAFISAAMLLALEHSQGKLEMVRQGSAIFLLSAAVVTAAYLEFTHLFIFPPLVPALFALASSAVLGLLWRSLTASSQLDASIAQLSESSDLLATPPGPGRVEPTSWFPHGLQSKARKVRSLNATLVERARFVDLALRSVEDGLLIAELEGRITFANRSAETILGAPPGTLIGKNLLRLLGFSESDLMARLIVGRKRVEQEIEIRITRPRRYMLRMACVAAGEKTQEPAFGIVASLSDVTRQHELQQTKNDVIALVSHEMRTPLTSIQGMAELLANYDIDELRRREMSAVIHDEAKRLTEMITEYLDITRLEAGATPLQKVPVNITTLLKRTLLLIEPIAAKQHIRLTLKAEILPALFADADLLKRAIQNLLSNAIKYSPENTEVVIAASQFENAIEISITDQGCGISEQDSSRIFDKFYKVSHLEHADVPGAGLGLALVREIAELHGGSVNVSSKLKGGSTFTLRIPLGGSGGGELYTGEIPG
jgi:PAS domain S-box-containing protein